MNADELEKLRAEVEELRRNHVDPAEVRELRRRRRAARARVRAAKRKPSCCTLCGCNDGLATNSWADDDWPCAKCGRGARLARRNAHDALTALIVAQPKGEDVVGGVARDLAKVSEVRIGRSTLIAALHSDPRFEREPGRSQFDPDMWSWGYD